MGVLNFAHEVTTVPPPDVLDVRGVHQWAHVGAWIERVSQLNLCRVPRYRGDELFGNLTLHEQPGVRRTDLSLVGEGSLACGAGRSVDVGDVVEHNVGALAAAFELDLLQRRFATQPQEGPTYRGRTGEGKCVDAGVPGDGSACHRARAGHDVENTVRKAGRGGELGEA